MILLYQAVQILYWLTLSVWLGCTVFLAVGAPVIFRVVRRLEVRSSKYADPALDESQTEVVAGEIVGTLLARLGQVQMICAIAIFPMLLLQLFLVDLTGNNFTMALLRFVLWIVLVALLVYEWRSHYPRTWHLRQQFLDSIGDEEASGPAREAFEREHRRSEQLFLINICLLIGLVMMSANVTPRAGSTALSPVAPQIGR